MSTINLAPSSQYLAAARQRRQYLLGLAVFVVILLAIVWGILFGLSAAAERGLLQVRSQLNAVQVEIATVQADNIRIESFEGRLAALDVLLANRVSVVPVLQELERLLPAPTVLTRFLLNMGEGTLQVMGSTAVLDEVAQTIASLDRPGRDAALFQNATIISVKRQEAPVDAPGAPSRYDFDARIDVANKKPLSTATPGI